MPIRWDKFTVKAQEAVQRGSQLASENGNPELQPLHLLAALLEDKEGIVPPILEKIGIGPQSVLSAVYAEIEKLPKVSGEAAQATLANETNKLLDQAFKEVVGRAPVAARAGGSIPIVPALASGGAPVVMTGIGLPDDRLHAPNEKLDLKQLWDGIQVFKRFYELLGER